MKQEQVIEFARKAGISQGCDHYGPDWTAVDNDLVKFAKLVEQATLERAAVACEQSEAYRGSVFAARIRALKEDV